MGYNLHITRASDWIESESAPIAIDEWKRAVASVPGIRLDDSALVVTNPKTGEKISLAVRDGDVAVFLDGEWFKVFHYREGRITFKPGPVNFDDPKDPVAAAAIGLARILGANIVGDEGEIYWPKTKTAARSKGKAKPKGKKGRAAE